MAVASNFPAIRPSLDLNFAAGNFDPRITFSRASVATYYDGRTVAKAEENLLVRSQEFDQSWAPTALTISPNSTTAPDGTTTADTFTPAATNTYFRVTQKPFASVGPITLSVYVKANGYTKVALREDQTSGAAATFDLATGAAIGVFDAGGVTVSNAAISSVGNSWYRISCTFSGATSVGAGLFVLDPSYTSGAVTSTWTANGTSGIYLWGAQLEQRSSATAYTPTMDQPITKYSPVLQTAFSGVPRIDHDPVTGECKGLLIEEQRTNLFTYSEFQTGGDGVGLAKASSIFGPLGDYTGAIAFARDTTSSYKYKTLSATSGVTYTFSCYVKFDDGSPPVISGAVSSVTSDFAINVQGTLPAATAYKIESVGNGLYRVSASTTVSADNPSSNNGLIKYASNSARTFKTTGWQLEVGDEATSYIKTDASQVTRAADDPSMIGANFSSWYRQDEGTFFAGASTNADVTSTSNRIDTISLSDGSQPNLIVVGPNTVGGSNILTTYASTDAVAQCVISAGLSGAKSYRFAVALSANNFAMSLNGSAALTDSVGTMPRSIDRLFIGRRSFTAAQYQNGHIKRITYYPKRLTDAQLQALTA